MYGPVRSRGCVRCTHPFWTRLIACNPPTTRQFRSHGVLIALTTHHRGVECTDQMNARTYRSYLTTFLSGLKIE